MVRGDKLNIFALRSIVPSIWSRAMQNGLNAIASMVPSRYRSRIICIISGSWSLCSAMPSGSNYFCSIYLKWQLVLGLLCLLWSVSILSRLQALDFIGQLCVLQSFGARCANPSPPHPPAAPLIWHSELFTVPYFLFIVWCTGQSSSFANVSQNVLRPRYRNNGPLCVLRA